MLERLGEFQTARSIASATRAATAQHAPGSATGRGLPGEPFPDALDGRRRHRGTQAPVGEPGRAASSRCDEAGRVTAAAPRSDPCARAPALARRPARHRRSGARRRRRAGPSAANRDAATRRASEAGDGTRISVRSGSTSGGQRLQRRRSTRARVRSARSRNSAAARRPAAAGSRRGRGRAPSPPLATTSEPGSGRQRGARPTSRADERSERDEQERPGEVGVAGVERRVGDELGPDEAGQDVQDDDPTETADRPRRTGHRPRTRPPGRRPPRPATIRPIPTTGPRPLIAPAAAPAPWITKAGTWLSASRVNGSRAVATPARPSARYQAT